MTPVKGSKRGHRIRFVDFFYAVNEFRTLHTINCIILCCSLIMVECCIKEAMRLYPPVPLTCRQNIKDDVLGGYFIPAGTIIALQVGTHTIHYSKFTSIETCYF